MARVLVVSMVTKVVNLAVVVVPMMVVVVEVETLTMVKAEAETMAPHDRPVVLGVAVVLR